MGVDGLLKFLEPLIHKQHLSTFRHQRAAIDIMSWIYRAYYIHAEQIRNQQEPHPYLNYIQQMLDLFQYYQIDIICVFDGRFVSHKQATVDKRKLAKEANRKKGEELLEKGQEQQSKKYLNRCINIDQTILSTTMRFLKGRNVKYIVAPYEADSQIAKLYHLSLVDLAVCEDSDQIIYGVPVLLKLSTEGDCDYLDINQARLKPIDNIFVSQFVQMTKQKRTEVAVLAGTDYLPSIKGIGIKTAVKYIAQFNNIHETLQQLRRSDRFKSLIPDNYEADALQAKLIFMLATCYNSREDRIEFLDPNYVQEVVYDEFSQENIKKIVGLDYGYNLEVSRGQKTVWNNQPRDLTPLTIDKTNSLNMDALYEKEMSLANSTILKDKKQTQSEKLRENPLFEQQLMMICENRQSAAKSEEIARIKEEWEMAYQSDSDKLRERETKMREKFGDWMKYCPLQ